MQKVPYILVVGKAEAAQGWVAPNERGKEKRAPLTLDAMIVELRERVERKT